MEEQTTNDQELSTGNTKRLSGYSPQQQDLELHTWLLRFELPDDSSRGFDVELNREMVMGTAPEAGQAIDLKAVDGIECGVSRRHVKLLPLATELIVIDLDSTNGTRLNDHPIPANTPFRLMDGDLLSLGRLDLVLRVIIRPGESSADLRAQADLAEALAQIGKSITSELDLDEILTQAVEMAMTLTAAGETSIWLLDPLSGKLYHAADRSHEPTETRNTRPALVYPLIQQVLETGKPVRTRRDIRDAVRVVGGQSVNAALYVPLIHRSGILGVMGAMHQRTNRAFTARDERILEALGEFVAIAIYNAYLYGQVQEADRLKAEMIQNLAHEFRTPLTYLMGYMSMMLDEPEGLSPEYHSNIDLLFHQSQRLKWMIDNLVSLASFEQVVAERAPEDPAQLLDRAVRSAKVGAMEKRIDLQLDLEDSLPLVQINAPSVHQVVDNLIANAFKFTPEGGRVTVQGRFDPAQRQLIVRVGDSGVGIPENCRNQVFDRFYQVDGTTTRRYGGVGIGLAVCKAVIEAHGERIWVECPETGGSVFSFTLPLATEQPIMPLVHEAVAGD